LAWKKQPGLLGNFFFEKSVWGKRWIVVAGGKLRYYIVGEEDGGPRGSIDLFSEKVSIQVTSQKSPDAPTPHEVDITSSSESAGAIKGGGERQQQHNSKAWKFCFDSQQDLMQFLEVVHDILDKAGQIESKDLDRFEHELTAGDHIFRWEMIVCPPVIYPIQIHGIVLEAGRNCVVIADFGLTGYGRKEGDDFNHADADRNSNAILAAWKKLRPKEDQRLNVVTVTNPLDIRKWTKANYEESFFKRGASTKKFNLSNFLGKLKTSPSFGGGGDDSSSRTAEDSASLKEQQTSPSGKSGKNSDHAHQHHHQQPPRELPKSDPKEIVLARANFLLEYGEEILPPYHVFYSNSECIAVWCKTGRWSTLQTAVFLSSTSVGGAKSATMATLGVAAAHALLAPVVAVGGLIWVSAPMVILKKSREKWEEATVLMTELFWEWAPPAVFVAAIETGAACAIRGPVYKQTSRTGIRL